MKFRIWPSVFTAALSMCVTVLWAEGDGASTADAATAKPEASGEGLPHDPASCAGCSAEAIWTAFLEHLRATQSAHLIPEDLVPTEDDDLDARDELQVQLVQSDPVKGILFKLSPDLVNLDALWRSVDGETLGEKELASARELAAKLMASGDKYLEAYGILFASRAQIQAEECPQAVKSLEGLVKSCFFLPRREARRQLARAYSCAGDDTLALLELQFYQLDLPPESDADSEWAREQIKKIRDKKHPGPLSDSEESMRSISGLISGLDVGEGTQKQERRVEDVLEKVVTLIEKLGGG